MKEKRNKTRKQKKQIGTGIFNKTSSFNYPMFQLAYDNKIISCEICTNNKFHKIDTSVERSKTAVILSDIFLGDDSNQIISHPLTMYKCSNCHNCKFFYAPTTWNGLKSPILIKQIQ